MLIIRASSFNENVPKISAKPIAFQGNFAREALAKLAVLYHCFSAKPASKIPAKSVIFSTNLSLKILRNLTFFPRSTRSPVIMYMYMICLLPPVNTLKFLLSKWVCSLFFFLLLSIIFVGLLETKVRNKVQTPCLWFVSGTERVNIC